MSRLLRSLIIVFVCIVAIPVFDAVFGFFKRNIRRYEADIEIEQDR